MNQFVYEARKMTGELISGVILADDMDDAGQKLAARELFVIRLGQADDEQNPARSTPSDHSLLKARRVRVMWFLNQLSVMIETGITVSEGIDCLSRQTRDKVMAEVLKGLASSINDGRSLSSSLEAYPRTFPRVMTSMVRAAEASGTLSLILNRVAQYMLREHQIMGRFRGALMYPAFMLLMCVGVTVFLLTTILPRFATIFAQKGAVLPAPTRLLLGVNDLVINYGLYILAAVVAGVVALVMALRTSHGKQVADYAQLKVPLVGNLLNKLDQSRTFRTLATLIEAGVPLTDTLALVRNISINSHYSTIWGDVERGVKSGERITRALARSPHISESIIQMIDCGDRSGRLGMVFTKLSDVIEQEYDEAIKTVAQFIEPIMILVMGGLIGFIAIALLLPMFKVSSVVAN